jgi:hypothetical protein
MSRGVSTVKKLSILAKKKISQYHKSKSNQKKEADKLWMLKLLC